MSALERGLPYVCGLTSFGTIAVLYQAYILIGNLNRHNVKIWKVKVLKKSLAFASFCWLLSLLASLCPFLLAGAGLLLPCRVRICEKKKRKD